MSKKSQQERRQKYSIILIFTILFCFTACSQEVSGSSSSDSNSSENDFSKSLSAVEKNIIKNLDTSTLTASLDSMEEIDSILESHINEKDAGQYKSIIEKITKSIKSANIEKFAGTEIVTAEHRNFILNEKLQDNDYSDYSVYEAYLQNAQTSIKNYDYQYNICSTALAEYETAFANIEHPKYDAVVSLAKSLVEDFKDNYVLNKSYDEATINNMVNEAKDEIEYSKRLVDSQYVYYVNAYNNLGISETEAEQKVALFNTFILHKQDGSEVATSGNTEDNEENEEVYHTINFVTNCGTKLQPVKFKNNDYICINYDYIENYWADEKTDISLLLNGKCLENWYYDADFTKPVDIQYFHIMNDITLYAKWAEAVNISFVTNCKQTLASVSVPKNSKILIYNDSLRVDWDRVIRLELTNGNYILTSWYYDSELTQRAISNSYYGTEITEDITLYAKWKEPVTISFVTNCDETFEPITIPKGNRLHFECKNSGFDISVSGEDYDRNTYFGRSYTLSQGTKIFEGWYSDPGLTELFRSEDVEQDITLYARFTEPVTISFVTNCNCEIEPITIPKGHEFTLSGDYFTRNSRPSFGIKDETAYTDFSIILDRDEDLASDKEWYFGGWYFDQNYENIVAFSIKSNYDPKIYRYVADSDITLYAYWPDLVTIKGEVVTVSSNSPYEYQFPIERGYRYFVLTADKDYRTYCYESSNKTNIKISVTSAIDKTPFEDKILTNEVYSAGILAHQIYAEKNDTCIVKIEPETQGDSGDAYLWVYKERNCSRNLGGGISFELQPPQIYSPESEYITYTQNGQIYTFKYYKNGFPEPAEAKWSLGHANDDSFDTWADSFEIDFSDYPNGIYIVYADNYYIYFEKK